MLRRSSHSAEHGSMHSGVGRAAAEAQPDAMPPMPWSHWLESNLSKGLVCADPQDHSGAPGGRPTGTAACASRSACCRC